MTCKTPKNCTISYYHQIGNYYCGKCGVTGINNKNIKNPKIMKTKTGIDLINQERTEQIFKHQRTPQYDLQYNAEYQLKDAARSLLIDNEKQRILACPNKWNLEAWAKMCRKNYSDRITISAALLAAELDRLSVSAIEAIIAGELAKLDNAYEDLKDAVNSNYGSDPGAVEVLNGLKSFRDTAAISITQKL
jgi:hypothetical protein